MSERGCFVSVVAAVADAGPFIEGFVQQRSHRFDTTSSPYRVRMRR